MADREQERAFRLARLRKLDGDLVEALGEERQLARAFDRDELRLVGGISEPACRLGHAPHRPRDRPREQERDQRRERRRDERGDDQPLDVRPPRGVRRARRPQEHEALAAHEPSGVEVARAVALERPVESRAAAELGRAIRRQERRRAVERNLDDPLVLALEEHLQRLQPREGEDRLALALDEEVELGRDVPERVPLDRSAGEDRADREGENEREERDEPDRGEEARAQRHGLTAL